MASYLYRKGRDNSSGLAPRAGKDVPDGQNRQSSGQLIPGLSFFDSLDAQNLLKGDYYLWIDPALLEFPLVALADDLTVSGYVAGHWTVTVVDEIGNINWSALDEWAACRGNVLHHELTDKMRRAVVNRARY